MVAGPLSVKRYSYARIVTGMIGASDFFKFPDPDMLCNKEDMTISPKVPSLKNFVSTCRGWFLAPSDLEMSFDFMSMESLNHVRWEEEIQLKKLYKAAVVGFSKDSRFMPYIKMASAGVPLSKYLRENPENAEAVIVKCLKKISKMHSCGVFHGDLKSDNFVIDKEGNVHVIDFDGAKRMGVNEHLPHGVSFEDVKIFGQYEDKVNNLLDPILEPGKDSAESSKLSIDDLNILGRLEVVYFLSSLSGDKCEINLCGTVKGRCSNAIESLLSSSVGLDLEGNDLRRHYSPVWGGDSSSAKLCPKQSGRIKSFYNLLGGKGFFAKHYFKKEGLDFSGLADLHIELAGQSPSLAEKFMDLATNPDSGPDVARRFAELARGESCGLGRDCAMQFAGLALSAKDDEISKAVLCAKLIDYIKKRDEGVGYKLRDRCCFTFFSGYKKDDKLGAAKALLKDILDGKNGSGLGIEHKKALRQGGLSDIVCEYQSVWVRLDPKMSYDNSCDDSGAVPSA